MWSVLRPRRGGVLQTHICAAELGPRLKGRGRCGPRYTSTECQPRTGVCGHASRGWARPRAAPDSPRPQRRLWERCVLRPLLAGLPTLEAPFRQQTAPVLADLCVGSPGAGGQPDSPIHTQRREVCAPSLPSPQPWAQTYTRLVSTCLAPPKAGWRHAALPPHRRALCLSSHCVPPTRGHPGCQLGARCPPPPRGLPRTHSGPRLVGTLSWPSGPPCLPAPQAWRKRSDKVSVPAGRTHRGAWRARGAFAAFQSECALQSNENTLRTPRGEGPGLGGVQLHHPARPLTHHWTGKPPIPRETTQSRRAVFPREAGGTWVTLKSEPQMSF